jgi:hypothetical protein
LGQARVTAHDLDLSSFGLQHVDLGGLDAQFGEDEVWAAIQSMPNNKSLGPDGFFKCCRAVVKEDVLAALHCTPSFTAVPIHRPCRSIQRAAHPTHGTGQPS